MPEKSKADIKRRVALANRIAYLEGLHEESGNEFSGHISVRFDGDKVIMPGHLHDFGRGLKDITPNDMILVNMEGKVIEGKREPVDEVVLHTSIYKSRPEINSVLHLHSPASVALACTDTTILQISMRASYFVEGVPILEKGPGVIDNKEIAAEMVKTLGNHNALLHKGHGVVTVGRNLEEACILGLYLEGAARNQILARQLGSLKPFSKEDALRFAQSRSLDKKTGVWKYYENKWAGRKEARLS
ncbi:MAG: class II aldolase/adducin family protein [Nitrososphaerales archaeon]